MVTQAVHVGDCEPLEFFMDPANRRQSLRSVRGVEVPLFEYVYAERRIWGATAQMLNTLVEIINKT